MARVLILTASYGSGHNAAARSLTAAFERAGAAVTVVDHFRELVHPEDERVAAEVRRRTRSTSIRTLGYVKDIRGLMAAADLLVTKAGGMTLAEALAAELPLVAFASLLGQEHRNERFASRHGVALIARSRRELARTVERALGDPTLLARLRERMRALRRPDASRRIVDMVLEQCVRVP